jgi:hypothetical protein
MPFQSKAQERFMFAKHPEIAKRWLREYGQPARMPERKVNPESRSNESPSPHVDRFARLPGLNRDFRRLHPSESARFKPAKSPTPNEREAHQESGVQHQPGSRTHRMPSIKQRPITGFEARDVRSAANGH